MFKVAAGTQSIWIHELFTVKRLTKPLPQIPASQNTQNTQDLNVSAHWLHITSQRNIILTGLDWLPSFSLVICCDLLCENGLEVTENSAACCLSPGTKLPETLICCLLTDQSFSLLFFLVLQQTVMQYQLSDDLPSAPPFRLFPTIERDTGGRSESHRVQSTAANRSMS